MVRSVRRRDFPSPHQVDVLETMDELGDRGDYVAHRSDESRLLRVGWIEPVPKALSSANRSRFRLTEAGKEALAQLKQGAA